MAPHFDPEFAAAIAQLPPFFNPPPSVQQLREGLEATVVASHQSHYAARLPPESVYALRDVNIPGHDVIRCVTPIVDDPSIKFPVFAYIHGGAKVVGSMNEDDNYLRCLAVELQVVTVNIGYRLAPEHPHTAAFEDCYAALKWASLLAELLAENAASLKADLTKGFLVSGQSAGANLVAILAHEVRDDPFFEGRRMTGQILRQPYIVYPGLYPEDLKEHFKSMDENGEAPPLPKASMIRLFDIHNAPLDDPRAWPLLYPSHEGLAPAYIQVMGADPLRDDGIVYEMLLKAAGVKTKLDLYPGVGHGVDQAFPKLKVSARIKEDLVKGYKWLLGREE